MESECVDKAYSCKHFKWRLIDHFDETLGISSQDGKPGKVAFKETTASIIHSSEVRWCSSDGEEKLRIINTAAKLIKAGIRE